MSSTQKNICCCCSKQDCYKSMTTEYFWRGRKEVYGNMLESVLNIRMPVELQSHSICEVCIQNLRQASDFKEQVLQVQAALVNQVCEINDTKINIDVMDIEAENSEETKEPNLEIDVRVERMSDGDDYKETDAFDDTAPELLEDAKEVTKVSTKFNLKRRITKVTKAVDKERGNQTKVKMKVAENTDSIRRKKEALMKETTIKLILNSNITVFDWYKNKYTCFFCKQQFLDADLLKEHGKTHTKEDIEEKLRKFNKKYYYRGEITNIECSNCRKLLCNIEDLIAHLIEAHSMHFQSKDHMLMPYRLSNLNCQLCSETFQAFIILDHHMSSHYSKYVCDTCGKGFRMKNCLKTHLKTHLRKKFECKTCKTSFENYYRKRKHDVAEHNVEYNNVCPHCPEKFSYYVSRLMHLIKVHGYKRPEFKCSYCEKIYLNKSLLRSHIRNVHLQERNFECSICQNKYLRKCELTDHMKSHIQARDFVCTYCGKGFFRRRNLNEHLAIHVEEFRHVCSSCGKSFAQKYNMKMHFKRCQESKKK